MAVDLDEQEIASVAYTIWEREGRPQGQSERHWRIAIDELRAKQFSQSGISMEPRTVEDEETRQRSRERAKAAMSQ